MAQIVRTNVKDFDSIANGVATIHLDSWESFCELVSDTLRTGLGDSSVQDWVFRGHTSDDYRLVASLDRYRLDLAPEVRLALYRDTLRLLRESGILGDLRIAEDAVLGGILQHYGAPTRLLDWTRSPYVAAYFAFMEHASWNETESIESCAIWALHRKSSLWEAQQGVVLLRGDYSSNDRARAATRLFYSQYDS